MLGGSKPQSKPSKGNSTQSVQSMKYLQSQEVAGTIMTACEQFSIERRRIGSSIFRSECRCGIDPSPSNQRRDSLGDGIFSVSQVKLWDHPIVTATTLVEIHAESQPAMSGATLCAWMHAAARPTRSECAPYRPPSIPHTPLYLNFPYGASLYHMIHSITDYTPVYPISGLQIHSVVLEFAPFCPAIP